MPTFEVPVMSMPSAVRHINEIRVLDALFKKGPMSRADLARHLGVTRSTASIIVAHLMAEGLIVDEVNEPGEPRLRTGRPSTQLRLRPMHVAFLGADIGVGHLTVVALDLNAEVISQSRTSFDPSDTTPERLIDQLVALVTGLMATLKTANVRGLTVTVPGLLDHAGVVLRAPILRWSNVPVVQLLKERLPQLVTITAENDANAFAMAELYRSGATGPTDAVYVYLDAGVGGGVLSSGKLLRGAHGFAGEIGHIYLGEDGYVRNALLPGCFESFVGREAVLARFRHHGGRAASFEEFMTSAEEQTDAAKATIADWSLWMGRGLAAVASAFDPQRIVLGGPVAALFHLAKGGVLAAMRDHFLPGRGVPKVSVSSLGAEAPALGAASILHRELISFDEDLVFRSARPKKSA
jgi:predicted NBD/HSP70 family sugar kinase